MDILKSLLSKLDITLYIQIWQKRLKITDAKGKIVFDEPPLIAVQTLAGTKKQVTAIGNAANASINESTAVIHPFLHPRTLLADFVHAEELLKRAYSRAGSRNLVRPSPRVIIHPMEKLEGGLTSIEMRALMEMAEGAGARWVTIHQGPELQIVEGQFVGYQTGNEPGRQIVGNGSIPWRWIKTWFLIFALVAWAIFRTAGNG